MTWDELYGWIIIILWICVIIRDCKILPSLLFTLHRLLQTDEYKEWKSDEWYRKILKDIEERDKNDI
jgi:hypothetical protein